MLKLNLKLPNCISIADDLSHNPSYSACGVHKHFLPRLHTYTHTQTMRGEVNVRLL